MRHLPETPAKSRRFVSAPAGVKKVSREDYFVAASSLLRWGSSAAVLGGLSTAFVGALPRPCIYPSESEVCSPKSARKVTSSEQTG
jgi:hypothetical protein